MSRASLKNGMTFESLLSGIAAQAAIAMDNARLYREAQKEMPNGSGLKRL